MTTPSDVDELRSLLLDTVPPTDPAVADAMFETTFAAGPDHGATLLPDEAFLSADTDDVEPTDTSAPDDPHDPADGGPDDPGHDDVHDDVQDTAEHTGDDLAADPGHTGGDLDPGPHDGGDLTWGA